MKNKLVCLILIAIMSIGIVYGCDLKNNQSSENTILGDEKKLTPVTIRYWYPFEGQLIDQYYIDAVKEFEARFPQIIVELTKLPSHNDDIEIKLNSAKLSDDYPDVFESYLIFIATHGSKGEFADMKTYIDQWDDKDDFEKNVFTDGQYKNQQLGIAFNPMPQILVYRTDYFKEAGLDSSRPPKDWNELKEYSSKLVKRDDNGKVIRAGFDIPVSNADVFCRNFMRQAGSLIVDEKNSEPSFTDEGAIKAFKFMSSLVNQSIPYNFSRRDAAPFLKGNAAMSILNTAQITELFRNDPSMKEKVAFAPVLEEANKSDFCGNRLFIIGAESKYKDQSWEFIKFLMSKEQIMKRAKDLNIPVVRKSLEKDYIDLNPDLNTAIMDYIKHGKGQEQVPWDAAVNKYLRTAYEEVYTKKKSVEEALNDADTDLISELETVSKKK